MKRGVSLRARGTTALAIGLLMFSGVAICQVRTAADSEGRRPIRVPMRDGVELAGDLYLPKGTGPFPTLVTKTPYDRESRPYSYQFFPVNGYAVLIVSQRGRFGSGGVFYQARDEGWLEHPDGYDTIEWAAGQPWSNGRIGTWGTSSLGQWQLLTAPTRPPHLRAMFCSYAADHRIGARLVRGVHTAGGPTWHHNNNAMARPLRTREDYLAWLADWKHTKLPFLMSFLHPELIDQFVHSTYDDYWREIDPGTRYSDLDVPVYHEVGWYDSFVRSTIRNFTGIRARGRSEKTRQSQKLIIGPWTHGGRVAPDTDSVKFGPQASIDRPALHLRWFDYWLKGIDTGIVNEPAVRVYLMGAERWLESDAWPLPDTRYVRYYLHAGPDHASHSLNDGRLSSESPATERPDEYVHDPYDPVPTIGGDGALGVWPPGPLDQRPAEARSLSFTTEPLKEDLPVVGEVRARFFASSSAVDTDFVLTLTDVYPNGYSALLRQSAIRAMYRLGEEREAPLKPGEVYEFNLELDATANLFKAGHRLRLNIASSSFPKFLPNPGTGVAQHLATEAVAARNAIYHDTQHPSAIELPVLGR